MLSIRSKVLIAAIALLTAGCESDPVKDFKSLALIDIKGLFQVGKGDPELAAGVVQYENGSYGDAAKSLQAALDQGLSTSDQVRAHKYLAFIHCVSARERLCRDEFHKALEISPDLELLPAEAGHPTWGPVFRGVKARK